MAVLVVYEMLRLNYERFRERDAVVARLEGEVRALGAQLDVRSASSDRKRRLGELLRAGQDLLRQIPAGVDLAYQAGADRGAGNAVRYLTDELSGAEVAVFSGRHRY